MTDIELFVCLVNDKGVCSKGGKLQSFKEDYNEWFNELQELKKDLTENDIFNLHLVGMYDM